MANFFQRLRSSVLRRTVDMNDVMAETAVQEILSNDAEQAPRCPRSVPIQTGEQLFWHLAEQPAKFYDEYRMSVPCFWALHNQLVQQYGLQGSTYMSTHEALAIFLSLCGHGETQRRLGRWYEHSAGTINVWYKGVLDAVCRMASDVLRPLDPEFSTVPENVVERCPAFCNAIGAIDGTHIPAIVENEELRNYYIGRKGTPTQNVLVACDFNMLFTHVYAGTPGSQHDAAVMRACMSNPCSGFPFPPPGKYYLVDSGYANTTGFLAPYRTAPYHPSDFNGRSPRGLEQRFNFIHASLRNIIERTIGVWKKKWKILQLMHEFDINIQVKIVIATATMHNFIRKFNFDDPDITFAQNGAYMQHDAAADEPLPFEELIFEGQEMARVRDFIARSIPQTRRTPRQPARHSIS